MNRYQKTLTAAAVLCALLSACGPPTATEVEAQKQDLLTRQGINQVGLPAIVNFQEKRVLKQILELRDTKVRTFTYLVDLQSKLHFFCDSIGYGIPYATQYTNPQMATWSSSRAVVVLPQADPNGLYSPAAAEGTWVLCADPNATDKDAAVSPIYVEPRVIVSPFKLKSAD
jgi:hypothetical protein